jgi:hypothetical protein
VAVEGCSARGRLVATDQRQRGLAGWWRIADLLAGGSVGACLATLWLPAVVEGGAEEGRATWVLGSSASSGGCERRREAGWERLRRGSERICAATALGLGRLHSWGDGRLGFGMEAGGRVLCSRGCWKWAGGVEAFSGLDWIVGWKWGLLFTYTGIPIGFFLLKYGSREYGRETSFPIPVPITAVLPFFFLFFLQKQDTASLHEIQCRSVRDFPVPALIPMYNEHCDDGKVYTRPRMGASYYHLICCNSILHDPLSLFWFFCGHGYLFFFSWTFMCLTFFSSWTFMCPFFR